MLLAELVPVISPLSTHGPDGEDLGQARQIVRARLTRDHSEREVVLTREGTSWQTDVLLQGELTFELAVAGEVRGDEPNGQPGRSSRATVELLHGGQRLRILAVEVSDAEGWSPQQIDLDRFGPGKATLVLSSAGPEPVAWSEPCLVREPDRKVATRPNLVLVIIDTLRSDHLSCYGYRRRTSPVLDRLAGRGYLFTRSYSASTWTLPSVATLLTGLLPAQHGLQSIKDWIGGEITTVAERLRAAGYRTAAFTDGGFLSPRFGFSQGFDRYDTTPGKAWEPKDVAQIVDGAMTWVQHNRYRPFFLLVHTYETHQPYTYRPQTSDRFLTAPAGMSAGQQVRAGELLRRRDDEAFREQVTALYDGEIFRADHHIGRLLRQLRELDLMDNTAILVTSDHGEELLEHGGVDHGHGKVFNENVRVPMILKPPGSRLTQAVISRPVSGVDVTPTLLELAGCPPVSGSVGRSLLAAPPSSDRRRLILVHGLNSYPDIVENRYRLDRGSAALVYDVVRKELSAYDLARDPEMSRPHAPRRADTEQLQRLQLLLASAANRRHLVVRLPLDSRSLIVPWESAVQPRELWRGLSRQAIGSGEVVSLPEHLPSLLVLDLAADKKKGAITLRRAGGETVQCMVVERLQQPLPQAALAGELPPPLVAMPSAARRSTDPVLIDEQTREDLRSLGYLQ